MTIPTEARELLDAAREFVICNRKSSGGFDTEHAWSDLSEAFDAYRATQVQKDCRPPDGAKDGSRWILTKGDDWTVREWRLWSGRKEPWWCLVDGQPDLQIGKPDSGWTVHSPCVFPGEGIEPTRAVVTQWVDAYPRNHDTVTAVIDAVRHFRAPKLRELSDEKIDDLGGFDFGVPVRSLTYAEWRKLARAVIAYVVGES